MSDMWFWRTEGIILLLLLAIWMPTPQRVLIAWCSWAWMRVAFRHERNPHFKRWLYLYTCKMANNKKFYEKQILKYRGRHPSGANLS